MTDAAPESPAPRRRRRRVLVALALTLLGVTLLMAIDLWRALGRKPHGEHLARLATSPQWSGDHFENPLPESDMKMWPILKAWLGGDEVREPDRPPPTAGLTTASFATPPASGLRLTWIGHSTFVIEIDGKRILTDPVWGERASPSSVFGPSRFVAPPIALADLPPIDAIVISHDHYDHLDHPTISALAAGDVPFYVPLGLGSHLAYWGVAPDRIHEMDWWDTADIGGVTIAATPSRHFSGRAPGGHNSTLWCSFALVGPQNRVFFSGDTALFPGFADIGAKYGPFDVTLMENGAYSALWRDVHLGPEQAIAAHRMLGGALLVPIHWGTFTLAHHAWTEPAERIVAAAEAAGVRVAVPRIGEQLEPADPPPLVRWWPEVPWQSMDEAPVISSGLGQAVLQFVPGPTTL